MAIKEFLKKNLLLVDGAMGTQIQNRHPGAAAWGKYEGCNEWLNLSAPEIIRDIHAAYFAAGSDAVETNSFGSSPVTLGEYNLSARAKEISRAAAKIARGAADEAQAADGQPRFVLGSVGPGTRLATLGQISFDDLYGGYQEQMGGLLEGGADGVIIETCQDLLQIKAAVAAAQAVIGARQDRLIYVSVTVETTGTLLVGSSIWAVMAALEPYPIDVLGLNCATGPEAMKRHLEAIATLWRGGIGSMPNAGLPTLVNGQVHYPLDPTAYTQAFAPMAREIGLNVAGGCCGTTPDHIRALRKALGDAKAPAPRTVQPPDQVTSLFSPMELTQDPRPLYVGERANATGSKKFRDVLLAENLDKAFDLLTEQDEGVAHVLDLSVAYAGRNEIADMSTLVARAARECRLPLMVDSTQIDVVEAALKLYGGRMLVNSINFESGEEKAEKLVELARRFGAGLVALTIDETGMAMTADRKVEIAKRLIEFCEKRGMRRGDLLIDTLTFTVCSGDGSLRDAAKETIEAIRQIKAMFPGVRTILGLSNVSFGLKPPARKVLNTVFLNRCVKAGMDACIINTSTLVPLTDLSPAAVKLAEKLLDNDAADGDPLENYIQHFEAAVPEAEAAAAAAAQTPEEQVAAALIKGKAALLETSIPALLAKMAAEDILNGHLIPGMKEVGRLFNDGILQLPFVLKSAEVMKKAVAMIKPHLKAGGTTSSGLMVIGTVAGDVHDIGKNLVDIILSNNGYQVVNLGVKVPIEKMMEAVRESKADLLGMSGLLVKSVQVMRENLKAMEAAGLRIPVLLGGAALTESFVANDCQPVYSGPVRYCKDAFDSLTIFRELMDTGGVARTPPPAGKGWHMRSEPVQDEEIIPPFWGAQVWDPPMAEVNPYIERMSLLVGRWGYKKGNLSEGEYRQILEGEAQGHYERLMRENMEKRRFVPKAAVAWLRCRPEGDTLKVFPHGGGEPAVLGFPRQRILEKLCIPDFFAPQGDAVGFFTVTVGNPEASEAMAKLQEAGEYQEYFFWTGFAAEYADAAAEWAHRKMLEPLGGKRGARFGPGYPSCPDMTLSRKICEWTEAGRIGVDVTESDMLSPEMSTCALIAHRPRARVFNTLG